MPLFLQEKFLDQLYRNMFEKYEKIDYCTFAAVLFQWARQMH